jgi:hypothetical protein
MTDFVVQVDLAGRSRRSGIFRPSRNYGFAPGHCGTDAFELLTPRTERLRGARGGSDRRRTRHELGEAPQVLRDRRQRELELCSARAVKA